MVARLSSTSTLEHRKKAQNRQNNSESVSAEAYGCISLQNGHGYCTRFDLTDARVGMAWHRSPVYLFLHYLVGDICHGTMPLMTVPNGRPRLLLREDLGLVALLLLPLPSSSALAPDTLVALLLTLLV
jgi:hypothetical protein